MTVPILGRNPTGPVVMKKAPRALKALELVVAPRLPKFLRDKYTGNPFTSEGDVVLDCDVLDATGKQCGWHAIGPRVEAKKAWEDHRRLYHSEEVGVVVLNRPRQ